MSEAVNPNLWVGVLILIIFLATLLAGMPIAFSALVSGLVGLFILNGFQPTLKTVAGVLVSSIASFDFAVLAFFILLGVLCSESGIADGLLDFSRTFLGHLSGGLAIATTMACALFGAISGSTTAASAVFAKLALPGMDKAGYDRKLSGGVVAASGTLAIMIPPSNLLLIYAIMAEQSVGKLLISGVLPGVLLTVFYVVTIWLQCKIDPKAGPPGPSSTWGERLRTLPVLLPVGIIFLLMMIGIYTGICSSTEASAVGVGAMFLLLLVMSRLRWGNLVTAMKQTVHLTASIMVIVMCIRIVSAAFAYSGFTLWLTQVMSGLPSAGITVMVVIVLVYFILGSVLGSMGMLFLTIPVFLPLIVGLGYDPIWFGVVTVCACEIAFITPPVCVNVYITAKVIGWKTEDIMNGVWLFVARDFIVLIILMLFPQISLWLPSMMK